MATTSPSPTQVRPRREREEELLVWPDLVFVEFICAVLFTVSFTAMSAVINAPLINRANPDVTPNPSKAPWYFLNLQELLLHMNPALAGVVVPTVALILLAAIPYLDRDKEGQGVWFGTKFAVRISVFSAIFATVLTIGLILFDSGKHAEIYENVTGDPWPVAENRPDWVPDVGIVNAVWDLALSRNLRAVQTEWHWSINLFGIDPGFSPEGKNGVLDWPEDFTRIPLPVINGTWWPQWGNAHQAPPPTWYENLPDWLTGLYPYDLNVNLPAVIVEQMIPTSVMLGFPILMVYILWRIRWVNNRRDVMLAVFSGFMAVFWVMTIVGAAFRGAGQDLVMPWDVPRIDG